MSRSLPNVSELLQSYEDTNLYQADAKVSLKSFSVLDLMTFFRDLNHIQCFLFFLVCVHARVCLCVCVREREHEREHERERARKKERERFKA